MKKLDKVTEYNIGNVVARLQTSKSINVNFYIFDFRQDLICANDSYTHAQTHTHTHSHHTHTHTHTDTELHDMPMAIGKSAGLSRK